MTCVWGSLYKTRKKKRWKKKKRKGSETESWMYLKTREFHLKWLSLYIQIKASKLPYLHQWEQKHSCLPMTWQPLDHWSWEGHRVWPSLLVVQSAQLWPDPDLMQPLSPSWPYPAVKRVLNLKKTTTTKTKTEKQEKNKTKNKTKKQQQTTTNMNQSTWDPRWMKRKTIPNTTMSPPKWLLH